MFGSYAVRLVFTVTAIAAIAVIGCSPAVQHIPYERSAYTPKPATCIPDLYETGFRIVKPHELIGEVWIHDTGFTGNCGKDAVREIMRRRACANGADAIRIVRESFPSFWSSCYRVKAYFVAYADPNEPIVVMPDARRMTDGVTSR
jgi:hypothetical protein